MQRGVRSRLEFGVIVQVRVRGRSLECRVIVQVRVKCRSLEFGVTVKG